MFNILWELGAKIKMFIQGLLTFITTWTLSLWRGPHMISSQKKKPHHGASPCFHLGRSLCVNIFNVLKIDGCKPCSIMIQFEIEWHSEVFWMIVKGHQDLKKKQIIMPKVLLIANQPSLVLWATPYTKHSSSSCFKRHSSSSWETIIIWSLNFNKLYFNLYICTPKFETFKFPHMCIQDTYVHSYFVWTPTSIPSIIYTKIH